MLRPSTFFSMLSWPPIVLIGLLNDVPKVVAYTFILLVPLTLIWHFIDVRHWRAFTLLQRVVWCFWSVAVLGLVTLMLIPAF